MSTHTFMTTRDGRIPTEHKSGKTGSRQVRSGHETVQFWIEGIYEREPRGSATPTSIQAYGDSIYSYGTHFEMARLVRNPKGRVVMILVSADTWTGGGWTSTGQHQSMVQSAVRAHAEQQRIPVLEIPFSVLDAANIDYASIRILEARESRWTVHEMSSVERPGVLAYVLDDEGEPHYICEPNEGDERVRHPNYSTVDPGKSGMQFAHAEGHAELRDDGLWHWTVRRHWMGDSLIRAKSTERRERRATADELAQYDWYIQVGKWADDLDDEHRASYVEGVGYDEKFNTWGRDVREYAYGLQSKLPNFRHLRSAASSIEFTVTRWATYLSSFDYAEPNRPYFFCELPYGANACTVDDGVATLKPQIVELHERMGDDVKRQGDVFAIATGFTTAELESRALVTNVTRYTTWTPETPTTTPYEEPVKIRRRGASETYPAGALDILGTNHQATHVIVTKDGRWFGRGIMYHSPSNREPDHRRVRLDNAEWYEFVKNTVPTTGGRRNKSSIGPGGSTFQSHTARAWSVGGGVD